MGEKRQAEGEAGGEGKPAKRVRYEDLPPFVERYAPYTEGFGTRGVDPVARAERMWNSYYAQNTTLGFKDRHYLTREVPELLAARTAMEVGCGVGNAVFPVLAECPAIERFYAFDLSRVAVGLLAKRAAEEPGAAGRVSAFQHDVSLEPLPAGEPAPADGEVDVATMIFVMSAIAPERMKQTVRNFAAKLRPGGVLYFRDYCEGDLAQKRFAASAQVEGKEKFYMRTCGTCSYFFSKAEVVDLFASHFDVASCEQVERTVVNHKEAKEMRRIWIHAKLIRKGAEAGRSP